ncbi:MAG: protein-L-isoaspartate(D-aspartate) O-methyltransferase [Spirochaetales bacterium]|nr:protein-L-isoaspartate(D-aspartate) O-methyltransferase [Spirochaetales bacterium]
MERLFYKPAFFLIFLFLLSEILPAENWDDPPVMRRKRLHMVKSQIEARNIRDKYVLKAMMEIPRHLFVPEELKNNAYDDNPLPIGEGQTISQPYIVALMTEILGLKYDEKVLEVGTGSGYQAAVLSRIVKEVYTIEIKPLLFWQAQKRLEKLGFGNIETKEGDGYFGWEEYAPYDCIMITAAVNHIPPPLLKQIKDGGKMVLPLGSPFGFQNLVLVTKHGNNYTLKGITGVLFVPMTGEAMKH